MCMSPTKTLNVLLCFTIQEYDCYAFVHGACDTVSYPPAQIQAA